VLKRASSEALRTAPNPAAPIVESCRDEGQFTRKVADNHLDESPRRSRLAYKANNHTGQSTQWRDNNTDPRAEEQHSPNQASRRPRSFEPSDRTPHNGFKMQFPYPRKDHSPTSPCISTRSSYPRRNRRLRTLAPYILAGLAFIYLLYHVLSRPSSASRNASSSRKIPPGTPEVVIVTTLDPKLPQSYRENIIANRKDYASRHGYTTFFPNTTDYDLMPNSPSTWSTIPALRHAMTLHPHSTWLWYLTSTALIMNPSLPLSSRLTTPQKLESLMIPNQPVVPPDSVIKTFSHLRGERVDFVLTQDKEGLAEEVCW